jgi:hypothetical protein
MKKLVFAALFSGLAVTCASAATVTLTCTGSGGSGVVSNVVHFNGATGTGSFFCDSSSLGAITITAESVKLFNDFQFGDGSSTDPRDNSAAFLFTNSATTWGQTAAGAGLINGLSGSGSKLYTVGNISSSANTYCAAPGSFTPGTCDYNQPATDAVTGAFLNSFTVNVAASVDAGGFSGGDSSARVQVMFTYNTVTSSTPEPVSMMLFGSGLLALSVIGRKKFSRR